MLMVSEIDDDHTIGVVALTDELAECSTGALVPLDLHTGKSQEKRCSKIRLALRVYCSRSLRCLVNHYFSRRERHFSIPCQPVGPSLSKHLRFKDNESAFHIQPLSAIGASRLRRMRLGELRDVFQGERKTSPFYPIRRRRPARECSDVYRHSDANRSP